MGNGASCRPRVAVAPSDTLFVKAAAPAVAIADAGAASTPHPVFVRGEHMIISDNQLQIILSTWSRIKNVRKIGEAFLMRTMQNRADVKKIFGLGELADADVPGDAKFQKHADKFGAFLKTLVADLHDVYIVDYIRKVGILHVYFLPVGMATNIWDHFAHCLIEVMVEATPKQWKMDFREAWTPVVEFMIWQMKDAYYDRMNREQGLDFSEPPMKNNKDIRIL